VVDEAALGQAFSEYFGFPCQSFYRFLYTHHHHHPELLVEKLMMEMEEIFKRLTWLIARKILV
jgi:hypothetical protein